MSTCILYVWASHWHYSCRHFSSFSRNRTLKTNLISRVSCQKGPARHVYAWQIGPFWQDTLDMNTLLTHCQQHFANTSYLLYALCVDKVLFKCVVFRLQGLLKIRCICMIRYTWCIIYTYICIHTHTYIYYIYISISRVNYLHTSLGTRYVSIHGFDTKRDLTIRRLIGYWNWALMVALIWSQFGTSGSKTGEPGTSGSRRIGNKWLDATSVQMRTIPFPEFGVKL